MLDNHEAIKLTGDARKKEIIDRLNDYEEKDLLNICRDANSWDGSFDNLWAFDAEDIDEYLCDIKPYDIMCRIVFGNVDNVNHMLRFDAYGNLESVHEWELEDECKHYIHEIADWLMDDYDHTDSLYSDDEELFETWWEIDHNQYDWDEEEEDE